MASGGTTSTRVSALGSQHLARRAVMLLVALAAGVALPGCSGCTSIEVHVRDVSAPPLGQPLVLIAEVMTEEGEPVSGLGVTFDEQVNGRPLRLGDAVTDADGIARFVVQPGLAGLPLLPGETREGYSAYFSQGNPGQQRIGNVCSDRSGVARIG